MTDPHDGMTLLINYTIPPILPPKCCEQSFKSSHCNYKSITNSADAWLLLFFTPDMSSVEVKLQIFSAQAVMFATLKPIDRFISGDMLLLSAVIQKLTTDLINAKLLFENDSVLL